MKEIQFLSEANSEQTSICLCLLSNTKMEGVWLSCVPALLRVCLGRWAFTLAHPNQQHKRLFDS